MCSKSEEIVGVTRKIKISGKEEEEEEEETR